MDRRVLIARPLLNLELFRRSRSRFEFKVQYTWHQFGIQIWEFQIECCDWELYKTDQEKHSNTMRSHGLSWWTRCWFALQTLQALKADKEFENDPEEKCNEDAGKIQERKSELLSCCHTATEGG